MKNITLWPKWQCALLIVALFLVVAIGLSFARLRDPAFGVLGDLVFHYQFTRAYGQSVREGDWWPRWAGLLSGGRGEALFTFYPPLCFLLTTAWQRLLNVDLLVALKLTLVTCFWLAQTSAYLFARLFFGRIASALAAVGFILLPAYPFLAHNRGLVPNALALGFLPLVLRAAHQLLRHEKVSQAVALFALSLSALIATHAITVYLCALAVAVMVLCYWPVWRWRGLSNLALASVVTFALTAFWLVPQVLEINWVNVKLLTEQHSYQNYFLFAPPASGAAYHKAWAGMNQAASWLTILQTALATFLAWALWRKHGDSRQRHLQRYGLALTAFGLILAFPYFGWLWRVLPGLPFLQFPWRWQPLVALAGGWWLAVWWDNRTAVQLKSNVVWLILLFICNGIFTYAVLRVPVTPLNQAEILRLSERADLPPVTSEELHAAQTRDGYDYLTYFGNQPAYRPRGAEARLYASSSQYGGLTLVSGSGEILAQELTNQARRFQLRNREAVRVRLNTYAYPHWVARLDGQPQTIHTEADSGLMWLDVPAGEHSLQFTYEIHHPLLNAAQTLSRLAWLGFALWTLALSYRWLFPAQPARKTFSATDAA